MLADDVGEHRRGAAVADGAAPWPTKVIAGTITSSPGPDAGGQVGEVERGGAARQRRSRAGRRGARRTPASNSCRARAHRRASRSAACRRRPRSRRRSSSHVEQRDEPVVGSSRCSSSGRRNGSPKRSSSSAAAISAMPSGTRIAGLEAELGPDLLERHLVVARVLVALHVLTSPRAERAGDDLDEVELAVVLVGVAGVEDARRPTLLVGRLEHERAPRARRRGRGCRGARTARRRPRARVPAQRSRVNSLTVRSKRMRCADAVDGGEAQAGRAQRGRRRRRRAAPARSPTFCSA